MDLFASSFGRIIKMIRTVFQHAKKHPGVGCIIFMHLLSSVIISVTNVKLFSSHIDAYTRPKKQMVKLDRFSL